MKKSSNKKMTAKKTSTTKKAPAKKAPRSKQAAAMKTASRKTAAKAPAAKKQASGEKPMSALDAAFRVLKESKKAMRCKELIEAMETKGYWTSPGGQTPHSTIYASMMLEERKRGKASRFKRHEGGLFEANR